MNRDIILQWLKKAESLGKGESIFLPCTGREASKKLAEKFKKELEYLTNISPATKTAKLQILYVIRDQRFWVEIRKIYGSPLIGFVKTERGIQRVELEDPARTRRILCMKEDGFSLEEVEELEGELTDKEREVFSG